MTQSLLGILADCLCFGLVFARMSLPQWRASTVVFSDKCFVTRVRGALYLSFRAAEMRSSQLVEAHVRCYAIVSDESDGNGVRTCAMRLNKPDDELGAVLMLALPAAVVHRIDAWSPLRPPPPPPSDTDAGAGAGAERRSDTDAAAGACSKPSPFDPSVAYRFPAVLQRADDYESGNRETSLERSGGGTDDGLVATAAAATPAARAREEEDGALRRWWTRARVEVVVLLEGIEPSTGNTLQARHSYVLGGSSSDEADEEEGGGGSDVVFHARAAPCVFRDGGGVSVDFARFHHFLRDVPADGAVAPPTDSHA